jgi:hypothetical protein
MQTGKDQDGGKPPKLEMTFDINILEHLPWD